MRYRINVIMETDLVAYVEADSEDEAWKKAEDMDGADFTEDGDGDWRITSVEKEGPIQEQDL